MKVEVLMLFAFVNGVFSAPKRKPNIIFILADDMGWADVNWNDYRQYTPHLNALYQESMILQNYYVNQVCTPSRAAIMTGKYPMHLGLQKGQIAYTQPQYLPLNVTTLQEKLKALGYTTHAVGKWHLGFCHKEVTPTYRGFDSFYGMWLGAADHFRHCKWYKKKCGLDFHDNLKNVHDQNGVYSTNSHTKRVVEIIKRHDVNKPLYMYLPYQVPHSPVQAPQRYKDIVKKQGFFKESDGLPFVKGAMIASLDEAVGNITAVLKKKGLYDNSIIVFGSDNGGAVHDASFNYPYRGSKGTLYEGGTKVVGIIHGPQFTHSNHTGIFHAVDWLPTLVRAAGSTKTLTGLDGMDQWQNLLDGTNNGRSEFIYNIDETKGRAGIRVGKYKLLLGEQGGYDWWYTNMTSVKKMTKTAKTARFPRCPGFPTPSNGALLFDLEADPYEKIDLTDQSPEVVQKLYARLQTYYKTLVRSAPRVLEPAADPINYNNTWSYGWCELKCK